MPLQPAPDLSRKFAVAAVEERYCGYEMRGQGWVEGRYFIDVEVRNV